MLLSAEENGISKHPSGSQQRRVMIAGEPAKWRPRALSVFLRPWFARGAFRGMGRLTTVGRKTSKLRRHAVRAIRKGTTVYVVSIPGAKASWLLNIRANPRVKMELRGAIAEGTAQELGEGPEREEARAAYVGTVNRADYLECILHWRGLPRRWKIQQLHEMWFDGGTPIRIDLDS